MSRTTLSIPIVLCAAASTASAGSGKVNQDGTIDLTAYFLFPPSAKDKLDAISMFEDASELLWNASEGQLRIGKVRLTDRREEQELSDVWISDERGRSNAHVDGLERRGARALIYREWNGFTLAHEIGHLALGLRDEYAEAFYEETRTGLPYCSGMGKCIEDSAIDASNNCIMQSRTATEFCVPQNHDLVQGDGQNCPPCQPLFCPGWLSESQTWETTKQQAIHGCDCWTHLASRFEFLSAPTGLPSPIPPDGYSPPSFFDEIGQLENFVMLVLDRSGSMAWNTADDYGEVCNNGIDDNRDGKIDEQPCTEARIDYVKASARAVLSLAEKQGIHAGIVSFASTASLDASLQQVDQTTIGQLRKTIDSLSPRGGTAIGDGLYEAMEELKKVEGRRSIFLITDGRNNAGMDPIQVGASLRAEGICLYSVSTGEASDSSLLSALASDTCGGRMDTRDAASLVSTLVQQWSSWNAEQLVIPKLRFSIETQMGWGNDPIEAGRRFSIEDWFSGTTSSDPPLPFYGVDYYVHEGTEELTIAATGTMGPITGFGVEAILIDPNGASYHSDKNQLETIRDSFFTIFQIPVHIAGPWRLLLTGEAGSAKYQAGDLLISARGPSRLITDLDRSMVMDPLVDAVDLRAFVYQENPIIGMESVASAILKPDGSIHPISLSWEIDRWSFDGSILGMQHTGLHQVLTAARSGKDAVTYGGESLFDSEPDRSERVYPFEMGAIRTFWVEKGEIDERVPRRPETP